MVLLALALVHVTAPSAALAAEPKLIAATKILLNPKLETPFPIQIENSEQLPKNCFLRIRGNLSDLNLSQGHRVSENAWAVPLRAVAQLRIMAEKELSGPRDLQVVLVALEGQEFRTYARQLVTIYGDIPRTKRSARLEGKVNLAGVSPPLKSSSEQPITSIEKAPAQKTAKRAPQPTPPLATPSVPSAPPTARQPPTQPPVPAKPPTLSSGPKPVPRRAALSPAQRVRAQRLVQRGDSFLAAGSIELARSFFQRAAEMGLADAAMAMGSTYDRYELERLRVFGLEPDAAAARKWYQLALDLGARGADARLRRLRTLR